MAHLSAEVVEERIARFGKLYMIDDIVRQRAGDEEQCPILGYPRHKDSPADYEFFTGRDLDCMVDEACRALVRGGFEVNSHKTVALYAPSDLSFVVTFFALFRLGCKVLTISIRLGAPACLVLLDKAQCDTIIHGETPRIRSVLTEVNAARPDIILKPMLVRGDFDKPDAPPQPPFKRPIPDLEAEHASVALMMHSSGSTGLPKPLLLSHRSLLHTLVSGTGLKAFNALPWYHLHGLITSVQAMWMCRTAHLFNAELPLTADNLVAALERIQPEICHTVPYALKLMAELPAGVEVLKKCKFVTSAGARTPDELGDRVVKQGVRLGVVFGLTEVGHMGDSIHREPGDDSWAYVRPYANLKPHMLFKKLDDQTYESVYLKSHPALMISNSDDPPGSFHSKDLFTPHPTISNAWKYVARDDDRITLLNGEKILPLTMEGTVRENPLVRDALMVGIDRPVPGMLIFRAAAAAEMTDNEFIKMIWPSVEEANRIADEFARIVPEMVAVLASNVEYPCTDKNNIIRAQAYSQFADNINALYSRMDDGGSGSQDGRRKLLLDTHELEAYLAQVIRDHAGIDMPDATTDFFAAGIDSLRAIQIRRILQDELDLGGHALATNVVYDTGNIQKLAKLLWSLPRGGKIGDGGQQEDIALMQKFVEKYSNFHEHHPGSTQVPEQDIVVLTGATGALGAHILSCLLKDSKVKQVYCLVRGPKPLARIQASLEQRAISPSNRDFLQKVAAVETSHLDAPNLGLPDDVYQTLESQTTLIIHAAWPVNFNLSLSGFEPQIAGLHNLLELSLSVPFVRPARLLFASSISTAFRTPALDGNIRASISEGPIPSFDHAAPTGYARSKLVCERLCEVAAAAAGGHIGVLRIGQIAGDTTNGIWNDKEAIPLMVMSALEVRALPLLDGDNDQCLWMPVDIVAKACIEAAEGLGTRGDHANEAVNGQVIGNTNGIVSPKARYFNIMPDHSLSWKDDVLPALHEAGLVFDPIPFVSWISRVHESGEKLGPEAVERLPALKLVDYFHEELGDASLARQAVRFETSKTHNICPALKDIPDMMGTKLVRKFHHSWLRNRSDLQQTVA